MLLEPQDGLTMKEGAAHQELKQRREAAIAKDRLSPQGDRDKEKDLTHISSCPQAPAN